MAIVDLRARPELVFGCCGTEAREQRVGFLRHPRALLDVFDQAEGSRVRARCSAGIRIRYGWNLVDALRDIADR